MAHGHTSALEIKRIPGMFKSLPPVLVSCQPAADAMADKIRAGLEFGMDSTRVKYEIAHRIRRGSFDPEAVVRALAMSGADLASVPVCVTPQYRERHEPTWQSWIARAGVKDSRSLSDVCAEIRPHVEAVVRRAHRLRARQEPHLRLVPSAA